MTLHLAAVHVMPKYCVLLSVQFTVTFPRMRLRNAPLVHVLAQVAFSPVLNWVEHVPALQERLIDIGFPRVQRGEVTEILFAPGNAPQQKIQQRFDFIDREQRTAFVLSESSFVLHTTDYVTREPFLARLQLGLEAVQASMKVTLVERLGLRYIDLVQPDPGELFSAYVHQGLLGYPFRETPVLEASVGAFATQSVASTPTGTLAIRSGVLPPGQYLPPDLDPGTLLRPSRVDPSRPGLAVDFDHFTVFSGQGSTPLDFHPPMIIAHLGQLHTALRHAFRAIATDSAISRWGPWEEVR
jgi:uncharacterized protein (TIGR04255 family)